jgi:hypothetical protein
MRARAWPDDDETDDDGAGLTPLAADAPRMDRTVGTIGITWTVTIFPPSGRPATPEWGRREPTDGAAVRRR